MTACSISAPLKPAVASANASRSNAVSLSGNPRSLTYPWQRATTTLTCGGFVAKTAKVAPTAYVGPNAKVLVNAFVEGSARIEDFALVRDNAFVGDNAVVSDFAVVRDRAKVLENARVRGCAMVAGEVVVKGNARILEYAHVLGKGTINGDVLIKGFGEIHMQPKTELTGCVVAGEDLEVHLANYPKPAIAYGLIYGYNNADILQRELRDNRYLYAYWDFTQPRRWLLKDAFADSDGILRGEPTFVVHQRVPALGLNGKDQYAVVEGHIVDAAAVTYYRRRVAVLRCFFTSDSNSAFALIMSSV